MIKLRWLLSMTAIIGYTLPSDNWEIPIFLTPEITEISDENIEKHEHRRKFRQELMKRVTSQLTREFLDKDMVESLLKIAKDRAKTRPYPTLLHDPDVRIDEGEIEVWGMYTTQKELNNKLRTFERNTEKSSIDHPTLFKTIQHFRNYLLKLVIMTLSRHQGFIQYSNNNENVLLVVMLLRSNKELDSTTIKVTTGEYKTAHYLPLYMNYYAFSNSNDSEMPGKIRLNQRLSSIQLPSHTTDYYDSNQEIDAREIDAREEDHPNNINSLIETQTLSYLDE